MRCASIDKQRQVKEGQNRLFEQREAFYKLIISKRLHFGLEHERNSPRQMVFPGEAYNQMRYLFHHLDAYNIFREKMLYCR